MIGRVKMCKQDYGYLRMGGEFLDMGGGGGYYGPPGSMWWGSFIPFILPWLTKSFVLITVFWIGITGG